MVQTLTKEEEAVLVSTVIDELKLSSGQHRFKVLRDLVLILLGLRCGLRVGESQKLRVSDVWMNDGPVFQIHIPANFNKGNKEGWIVVNDDLREALKLYVPLRKEVAREDEPDPILLVPRPGLTRRTDKLSRPDVCVVLAHWGGKAKIRHFKYHTLRHTFATRVLMQGGGNLRTVQMLLRHRHLSSTAIYTHPNQDELDLAVKRAFAGGLSPSA